ncbi:putative RNA-binding protein C4F6.14 [Hypsizygus marmoreus]|uniref:RNA-binding protein C4F6.14 n=1 Tax=Hypsizygus marmoreus TaxID=39966 RepID=A0A369JXP7_HYPMA|nr:putative RNA-binding protein C4F6.14 [Hypsizygus marmoreus]
MASTLGKRKDREDEPEVAHGSTLFVSNLPYTATSVDLQTLFSDIAPVRSAFVVLEPGTGVSKGVGYVSFAIKEDAQSAFDTITSDGLSLVGRKLRVQWAENKPKEKGEVVKKESKPRPPPRPQQPRLPHDPLAIRTIVVSGLPPSIDAKTLWKKIRKYDGAEKVDWPIKTVNGSDDPSAAHVLFKTPAAASDAVSKLHAHVFKGCLLSVTLKKRLDTLAKPTFKTGSTADGEKIKSAPGTVAPSHNSRLIVRNLPFNATEQDLRAVFLPYGPIHSIHIPTAEKQDVKNEETSETSGAAKRVRTKGFAFVWMLSRKDAEKAIEGCNGMVVRAGTAESLVMDKQKKKKLRREEKKLKAAAAAGGAEGGEGEGEAEEVVDDKRATERVIAVDWALSKEKWKEEKAKLEEAEGSDVEMEDVSGSDTSSSDSDEDSEDDSDGSDDEGGLGVHQGGHDDDEDDDSEGGDEDEDREEPVKPTLPPPETGTTLFIRNVPFNATEDELRTLFRSFGPLRYARITIDPATGRSRGTGFACFWNVEDADKVVAQSDLLRLETTGSSSVAPKKNPFTLPSILTPDPSSTLAQSLVLHGRTLDVVRAVTRDEAGKLKEAGEKMREKADKRSMYLLREGVILPNTPAAETLTPAEVERRTASFNARRALLKSNPSLFISRTRLSIRQIPIFVSERLLKRMAIHACRTFQAEVKKGDRAGLSADELADVKEQVEESEIVKDERDDDDGKGKKRRPVGRRTGVKQAKIVRQMERVDSVTGKGRSKGYGFLEMNTHADALRVLRWANNNPELGPLFEEWWKDELKDLIKQEKAKETTDEARLTRLKEELERGGTKKSKGSLIVEFSIENVQVVQRRNAAQLKTPSDVKQPKDKAAVKTEVRSPKKRRVAEEKPNPVKEESVKPLNKIGSIIGRKRKERKSGKKGGH